MKRMHPARLIGLIFAILGFVFLATGIVLFAVRAMLLPQLLAAGEEAALAMMIVGLTFSAVGAVFAGVGILLLRVGSRQARLREELEHFGTRVQGRVTDIRIDYTYKVNRRSPLRIIVQAQHPRTGEIKTLRSDAVWETALTTGDTVDVLFDLQDAKKYVVVLPGEEN